MPSYRELINEIKPYTVLLMLPDWMDQADNGYAGTFQCHVGGKTPEDAIDAAFHEAARSTGRELNEDDEDACQPSDFAFVACFEGHLENQYTP